MKKHAPAWIVLGVVTIAAGLSLAVTNEVTKGPIKEQSVLSETVAKKKVMPGADAFDELVLSDGQTLFIAKQGEEVIGYVGKVERKGYGGMVEVIAGVKEDGTITGVSVGGSSFSETPGLGAKAKDEAFQAQFIDKSSPVRIGKDGKNAVDAITAATITTNAVIGGVNQIAKQVNTYLHPDTAAPVVAAEGTSYGASVDGFAGPVAVVVTVKDDGAISALKIGDDNFSETDGYGAGALEPAFAAQFVGKTLPLKMEDIEAVSGATVTTKAVVSAVNKAFEEKLVVATAAAPEGISYAATADGFGGPVAVVVTVKEDGTISQVNIGDEHFNETDGYGLAALEPEFAAQFVGKSMPVKAEDIEAISGATVTTKAVLQAINQAYEEKNIVSTGSATPEGITYSASSEGFGGPVAVEVTVKEDGTISNLKIGDDQFNETDGYGLAALEPAFAAQFVGKSLPVKAEDIEAVSGATITTNAVLSAINKAYEDKNVIAGQVAQVQPTPMPIVSTPVVEPEQVPDNAVTASKQGFAGPVAVTVSFHEDGSISYLKIGDASFAETKNFGEKALNPEFAESFLGKMPPLALRGEKDAALDLVDGISGATVTSQAIVDAINEAHAGTTTAKPDPTSAAKPVFTGDLVTVVKEGFLGPVSVTVGFYDDGAIASIKVGDEQFKETPGYGALALEPAFAENLLGKYPPLNLKHPGEALDANAMAILSNIDTVTSATLTSQAIVDAINEAYQARFEKEAGAQPSSSDAFTSITKQGFIGPVTVKVAFEANGAIQSVQIGDEQFKESDGYGALALAPGFAEKLHGKLPPLALAGKGEQEGPSTLSAISDADTATSATITTQAILDAINEAFATRP